MKKILLICLIPLLPACGIRTYHINTAFDEAQFQKYTLHGTSKITGQAFLKTRGGDVKYGAGNEVKLIPYNAYTHEIWQAFIQGYYRIDNKDPRIDKYVKTTIADGMGNFEFTDLPGGDYLLQCQVFWQVPAGYSSYKTGSEIIQPVMINEGQTRKVMLTEQ